MRNKRPIFYWRWNAIKTRCYNSKHSDYKWYGGKGVRMCKDWRESYPCFAFWMLGEMSRLFITNLEGIVIDRIDSEGDYSPSNCRLITIEENARRSIKNRDSKGRFCKEIA